LTNPTNGYTPIQIQKSTKKQIKEEEEEIARTNKAKTNTSKKRNLTTIWICKEVLAATILSIRPPNSHPDASPPPLLHLLFLLLLFVQLRLLLLLLLFPLHRNTILHLRNPANCYYYIFLRYKFSKIHQKNRKNNQKKDKKKTARIRPRPKAAEEEREKERNLMRKCDLPDASPP
jgi:hypothetical protein